MEILIELGAFCKINLNDKCLTKKKNGIILLLTYRLDVIEFSALQKNNEVSLAALKSFQELLYNNTEDDQTTASTNMETWNVSPLWFCTLFATLD